MIACGRSLFRVDCALKFVNSCVKSKPGHCSYYSLSSSKRMSREKDRFDAVDMSKKQKTVMCLGRPVSTQASAIPENGDQGQEVHGDESDTISKVVTDSTISSSALKDNVEDGALVSAEKNTLSIEVGASLFRFIKGKGGSTQKKIEEEMGVKIVFPSSKGEESISIEGISIDGVTRAAEKMQAILDEAVKSPNFDFSHFISLPLAIHPELVDKLVNFQNSILRISNASLDELENDSNEDTSDNEDKHQDSNKVHDVAVKVDDDKHVKVDVTSIPCVSYAPKEPIPSTSSYARIDKSIFIKPKLFHLTVLMLKLWNKERVSAASDVLKSVSSKVMDALDNRPVTVRLRGLECMKGSLAKARVLYATVEEVGNENRLLRACQVIIDAFAEAGLVLEKDAKQKLKLHATVMNVRHRKGKQKRFNDYFDARGIFKEFGSEEWGEYLIREAHLSQRFVYDENEYYHCCALIPFPESIQLD